MPGEEMPTPQDQVTSSSQEQDAFNALVDPNAPNPSGTVDAAKIETVATSPAATEAARQAAIANADREQRKKDGLQPPAADLR